MTNRVTPGRTALQASSSVGGSATTVVPAAALNRADAMAFEKVMEELRWLAYAANPFIEKSGGPPASPFGGGISQEPPSVRPAVVSGDIKSPVQLSEGRRQQNYLRLLASLEQEAREAMEKYTGNLTPTDAKKMLDRIVMQREGEPV